MHKEITAHFLLSAQVPENYQEVPVKLPLLRGRQFELLSVGELQDTLAHCLYCTIKIPNIDSRLSHIKNKHGQEYYRLFL